MQPVDFNQEMAMNSAAAAGGEAGSRLTEDDALKYLMEVKNTLNDQEKFDEVLQIMKDLVAHKTDAAGLITKVKTVLRGHQVLILGFNRWLPERYKTTLPVNEQQLEKEQPVDDSYVSALKYLDRIKTRFQNDKHVFIAFCDIIRAYCNRSISAEELHPQVGHLFTGHPDLLEEFISFVRDYSVPSINTVRPDLASRSEENMISIASLREWVHQAREKVLRRQKISPHVERDRAQERVGDEASQNGTPSQLEKAEGKRKDVQEDDFIHTGKGNKAAGKYAADDCKDQDLDVCQRLSYKKRSALRAERMIQKQYQEWEGAEALQDPSHLLEDDESLKVDKKNQHHTKQKDCDVEVHIVQEPKKTTRGVCFAAPKGPCEKALSGASSLIEKEKFSNKPISQIDTSNWERCTPSYGLLPKDYPKPSTHHYTELSREVLNDSWVSVPLESEKSSAKQVLQRNRHEQDLLWCEDERLKLDIFIESTDATARRLNELLVYLQNPEFNQQMSTFALDDYLHAINLRCIERIYGREHGLGVIDQVRKNPVISVPVVLARLRQKQDEWDRDRIEVNRVWAKLHSKNTDKPLGHSMSRRD